MRVRPVTAVAFAALVFVTGCGGADRPSPVVTASDPCAVALAPHRGATAIDEDIARFQAQARETKDSLPPLERLGWSFVARARTSFDPGFYTLAEQTARCMAARRPSGAEALLLRGHALHNLHRFREAEDVARALVTRRGRAFDHGLLGDALMEQGKLGEAVKAYQAMMDAQPGPQAYVRAAHVRFIAGDLRGAISLTRMAIGTSGFRDPEAAAWANTRLALYELQDGNRDEASRRLDVALALHADYAPALLVRGRLLLVQGEPARAIAPLTRAAGLYPTTEYHWTLVEALRASGRPEQADAVEAQMVRQGPATDRRTFALYLASVSRDPALAVRLAEEELAVRRDVFTLDALAWALRSAGRLEEARTYSDRALAEGTRDARLFYHAGAIAAALGRHGDAARRLGDARAIDQMLLPSERAQLGRAWVATTRGGT